MTPPKTPPETRCPLQLTPDEHGEAPDRVTAKMAKLALSSSAPPQAKSTREAKPPTWGQIKKLTREAGKVVKASGEPVTPLHLFLAILAVLSAQVSGDDASSHMQYWAYLPNPPFFSSYFLGNF